GCKTHVYGAVSDPSGGPVRDARVFLEEAPGHAVLTDDRGRFKLCTGETVSNVRVSADGYGLWSKAISATGSLRQDVTLAPASTLTGNVVHARDEGKAPFAVVTLRLDGDTLETRECDDAGHFEFAGLAPGNYAVEARTRSAKSKEPV